MILSDRDEFKILNSEITEIMWQESSNIERNLRIEESWAKTAWGLERDGAIRRFLLLRYFTARLLNRSSALTESLAQVTTYTLSLW